MINIGFFGVGSYLTSQPYINNGIKSRFSFNIFSSANEAGALDDIAQDVSIYTDIQDFTKNVDKVIVDNPKGENIFNHLTYFIKNSLDILLLQIYYLDVQQARTLLKLSSEADTQLYAGSEHLFHPVFVTALEKEKASLFIEFNRRYGRTKQNIPQERLLQWLTDDLSMILYAAHSPVRRFFASGANIFTRHIDLVQARVEFQNGDTANLFLGPEIDREEQRITFYQSKKIIPLNLLDEQMDLPQKANDFVLPMSVGRKTLIEAFLHNFITGTSSSTNLPRMDETWYESLKLAREIVGRITRYY